MVLERSLPTLPAKPRFDLLSGQPPRGIRYCRSLSPGSFRHVNNSFPQNCTEPPCPVLLPLFTSFFALDFKGYLAVVFHEPDACRLNPFAELWTFH
jgi:hypothetical protein